LYISGFLNRADIEETKKQWDFLAGRFSDYNLSNWTSQNLSLGTSGVNAPPLVDTSDPEAYIEEVDTYGDTGRIFVDDAFEGIKGRVRSEGNSCRFECDEDISIGFNLTVNYATSVKSVYSLYNLPGSIPPPFSGVSPIFFNRVIYSDRQGVNIRVDVPFDEIKDVEIMNKTPDAIVTFILDETGLFFVEIARWAPERNWALQVGTTNGDYYYKITSRYLYITGGEARIVRIVVIDLDNPYTNPGSSMQKRYIRAGIRVWSTFEMADIRVQIQIPPRKITAGQKYYFDNLTFSKENYQPLDFTYYSKTQLTPVFPPTGIGIGDEITPELILSNQTYQLSLINAVRHLFNLSIYTDGFKKLIFIETGNDFHTGPVIDWSGKTDLSEPVEIEEIGDELSRIFSIGYRDPDYSVQKFNEKNRTELGTYNTPILNRFAKIKIEKIENAMFLPTLVNSGSYPPAPDAKLIRVNSDNNTDTVVNFDTRIVKYMGVRQLPEDQTLEFPAGTNEYPLAVFADEGENLCFEDINDVPGLHKYYDNNVRTYNRAKRITCHMHLDVTDIEPFAKLNELKQDFRAKFRLKIDGEYVLCNLEEISDWKSEKESTKCTFIKRV